MSFRNRLKKMFGTTKKENIKQEDELPVEEIEVDDGIANRVPRDENTKCFRYLDELIHSGEKEIFLDFDVILDEGEELEYSEGIELDVDDITIHARGHRVDAHKATRIFNVTANNVTLKYFTFVNGYADYGGALYNHDGLLIIIGCDFSENYAVRGGAISNYHGSVRFENTKFYKNESKMYGGAVNNGFGKISFTDCNLEKNHANLDGGGLANYRGNVSFENCLLEENTAECYGGAVHNYKKATVEISNSHLTSNCAKVSGAAILNNRYGKFTAKNCEISKNKAIESCGGIANLIFAETSLAGVSLTNNVSDNEFTKDILNDGKMTLKDITYDDLSQTILNNSECHIYPSDDDLKEKISNNGEIFDVLSDNNNFKSLNRLVSEGPLEIRLENDIKIDVHKGEDDEFTEGIVIDRDFVVIDGQGHTIDGQSKARIFKVTAKDVIIKNVKFRAGYGDNGGAINNNGEMTLLDSEFIENSSSYGGAVYNEGKIEIRNSKFLENTSRNGGAVFNHNADMTISESKFSRNSSEEYGGAIKNNGKLNISKSEFTKNTCENSGGAINNSSIMEMTETVLLENTAFNGGCIFNDGKSFLIIKSVLSQNYADSGGAINNWTGTMTVTESEIIKNHANRKGGAIENTSSTLTIEKSKINENTSRENGGAILNNQVTFFVKKSFLTIFNSQINKNSLEGKGGIIENENGSAKMFGCEVSNNTSPEHIIDNHDLLEAGNTTFEHNKSECTIYNFWNEKSNLSLSHCNIIENETSEMVLLNRGKSCTIEKSIFKSNSEPPILNKSNMMLIDPKINDDITMIFNEGYILIKKSPKEILERIISEGKIEINEIPSDERFDFTHLDRLIHETSTTSVVLEEDITLETYESEFYEGGIELDIDGLVIDGQGKCIDASGKSRIFLVTANNITLKNIVFKNGYSFKNYNNPLNSNGGALRLQSDIGLTIENCQFIDNTSEEKGGAIHNGKGDLRVYESQFNANTSKEDGGAIYNIGNLTSMETKFSSNYSEEDGGAIYNIKGHVEIVNSSFDENKTRRLNYRSGGAIYNSDAELSISQSSFTNNESNTGGAIKNRGNLTVSKSIFAQNVSEHGGGAIENANKSKIFESEFVENKAYSSGGAIDNRGKLSMEDSRLYENRAWRDGGAIMNWLGGLSILKSILNGNVAKKNGGAAYTFEGSLKISECSFEKNVAEGKNGGAIHSKTNNSSITNTEFSQNRAKSGGAIFFNEGFELKNCTFNENIPDDM